MPTLKVAISVKIQRWTRPRKDYDIFLFIVRNINKGVTRLNYDYFNVSSIRLMRFLYSLGFEKESYINIKGKENWRFYKTQNLTEALNFYYYMRKKNLV